MIENDYRASPAAATSMALKQTLKRFFTPGTILRLRDSRAYEIYLSSFKPESAATLRREKKLFANLLSNIGPGPVFDIGANYGSRATHFLATGRNVICLEPSEENGAILRDRFKHRAGVTVVPEGVSSAEGIETFHMFDQTSGFNTFSSKWSDLLQGEAFSRFGITQPKPLEMSIKMTTLDRLIERFGRPSYVKIDVEGYELKVLQGLSTPVPLLSIECNLPEFVEETLQCITRLGELSPLSSFNFCRLEPSDTLALQNWCSVQEIQALVRDASERFMEIFVRMV